MADIFNLTDTWNSGGTTFDAIKMNVTDTASAAASTLLNLQVGGTTKFKVVKDGSFYWPAGSGAYLDFNISNANAFTFQNGGYWFAISNSGPSCVSYNLASFAGGSPEVRITTPATDVLGVRGSASTSAGGAVNLVEMTAPSAPSANQVVIYAEDNGAGKTRLMARFNTGAAQQIAIEP